MPVPARLRLDFSPANGRPPLVGWILLALGAASLVLAGIQFHSAHAALSREADQLQALQARVAEEGGRAKSVSGDSRDAQAAAAVIRSLRVPWPQLLDAFEGATSQNVALLAIEPTPAEQQVRLTAEAKNIETMLDYLEALKRRPLTDVVLINHQVNDKVPGSPVRFQAQAKWKTK
jgi:Tfp pilus assembly protein PilN